MPQYSHWHYVLGYLIVTTVHNWPVVIALAASTYCSWRLYRNPTRRNVQLLYGWVLLVFAYEYVKHLSEYLSEPVDFLLTADWTWMQPVGHLLVEWLLPPILIVLALLLLVRGISQPRGPL
jgi:hypothetical protein